MTYRSVLGLRQEEVEDHELHSIPGNEDDVRVPANRLQGDRAGELAKQPAGVDSQGGKGHALGTHLEGKDLNWVQSLQGREIE